MLEREPWHPAQMMWTGLCLCCTWLACFGGMHGYPYSEEVSDVSPGYPIQPKPLIAASVALKSVGYSVIFKTLHWGWVFCALGNGTKVIVSFWGSVRNLCCTEEGKFASILMYNFCLEYPLCELFTQLCLGWKKELNWLTRKEFKYEILL